MIGATKAIASLLAAVSVFASCSTGSGACVSDTQDIESVCLVNNVIHETAGVIRAYSILDIHMETGVICDESFCTDDKGDNNVVLVDVDGQVYAFQDDYNVYCDGDVVNVAINRGFTDAFYGDDRIVSVCETNR